MAKTQFNGSLVEFANWLGLAEPGDRCIYYVGFLMADRVDSRGAAVSAVAELANAAATAQASGRVRLLQRRLGPRAFEYIAEVRLDPAKAQPPRLSPTPGERRAPPNRGGTAAAVFAGPPWGQQPAAASRASGGPEASPCRAAHKLGGAP